MIRLLPENGGSYVSPSLPVFRLEFFSPDIPIKTGGEGFYRCSTEEKILQAS